MSVHLLTVRGSLQSRSANRAALVRTLTWQGAHVVAAAGVDPARIALPR